MEQWAHTELARLLTAAAAEEKLCSSTSHLALIRCRTTKRVRVSDTHPIIWQCLASDISGACVAPQVLDCNSLPGSGGQLSAPVGANGRAQISTFCARHDLIAAGGFAGELDVTHIHRPGLLCRQACWLMQGDAVTHPALRVQQTIWYTWLTAMQTQMS